MPTQTTPTTAQALEAALITRILAIVPTHLSQRSSGWALSPDNTPAGTTSQTPRLFYTQITPGSVVPAGLTGDGNSEVSIGFDVVADYGAFPPNQIGTVVEMDQWDLHDSFAGALDPVILGLTHSELAGEPQPDGDEDSKRVRFPFLLHYYRVRN